MKGIIGMHRFNICLVVVLSWPCSGVKTPYYRPIPTELFYVKRETDVRKKIGFVNMGFLLTGQRIRLVPPPGRLTVDSGRQHPLEKTDGGQIGSVDRGLKEGQWYTQILSAGL